MPGKNSRLAIRMPENSKLKQKSIALMEKAAGNDNTVIAKEKVLLKEMTNR